MAEKRTRRRFTAAFKAQAVKRLMEGGRALAEVATELGLSTASSAPGEPSSWPRARPKPWPPVRRRKRRCCGSSAN